MKFIVKYIVLFFQAWVYASAEVDARFFSPNLGACGLVAISSTGTECVDSDGGIVEYWVADCDDINITTIDVEDDPSESNFGQILDITANTATPFTRFVPADDDTAFYSQTGERDGNKFTVALEVFSSFKGLSQAKINAANSFKSCCCLFVIVRTSTNQYLTVGIDWDVTNGVRRIKKFLKAVPTLTTDTPENEDRLDLVLEGEGRGFAPSIDITSFTPVDLAALTINP